MSDLSVAFETEKTAARPPAQSADDLAEELRREIAWLKFDSLALKEPSGRICLGSVVSSAVSAAGSGIGRTVLRAARRDPLPFAAAIAGIAWFGSNALSRSGDARTLGEPGDRKETPIRHRNIVPALAVMLGAGAIIGAKIRDRQKNF